MNLKRIKNLLNAALIFSSSMAIAQPERQDRIETIHIAYLTQKLNLTPDEAKNFWPVYNQFKADMDKLRQERKETMKSFREKGGMENLSDQDAQKLIAAETDFETKQLELRKEYVQKFEQVLPVRKVARLFMSEEQFKRYLLNQLGKRHNHGGMSNENDDPGLQ